MNWGLVPQEPFWNVVPWEMPRTAGASRPHMPGFTMACWCQGYPLGLLDMSGAVGAWVLGSLQRALLWELPGAVDGVWGLWITKH